MHKILIVDDEAIFRKGLRKMIAALGEQWDVVGEAKDGYEAIELIEQLKPDVLLTDIRMPRMDGIQLQQLARERVPDLVCVVISGYDEFSYVQQSLRMGVKDYLLKPIEREQLADVLGKLETHLEQREELRAQPGDSREEMLLRRQVGDRLFEGLLRGYSGDGDLELLRSVGVELPHSHYACMVVKLDKHSVDQERFLQADPSLFQLYIQQFANELLNRRMNAYCFAFSDTEVVALINCQSTPEARTKLVENAESLRREIKALSKLTVTIGIGRTGEGIGSVSRSYHDAEIALLHRLIAGGDKVLNYEIIAEEAPKLEYRAWSWETLEQAIYDGDAKQTSLQAKMLITDLCERMAKPEAVHQQLCKLIIRCYEVAGELELAGTWLEERDIRSVLFELCSISSREELVEECGALLSRLAAALEEKKEGAEQDPVRKSLRYLERHYREPITLKDVADHVYLNPAYFSTLFKQKLGKSFVEQLTEIRVEAAKKRLSLTNDKIASIAEQTGFANLRHFNRVFKKETSFSPKSYREKSRRTTS